jgi:hypothetical protein
MEGQTARLAVRVPAKIRRALRALKEQRELAEGRPVTQASILAELIEREAAREGVSEPRA